MKLFSFFRTSKKQEIGKTISWKEAIGMVFKVLDFDTFGTTISTSGNVIAKSDYKPYGYLIVTNPNLKGLLRLPIIHSDDFLLASSVFGNSNLKEKVKTNDFLVTFRPKIITPDGSAGIHHAFHYVIAPLNTLNNFYSTDHSNKTEEQVQSLFIKFIWEREIKVQMNPNPFEIPL